MVNKFNQINQNILILFSLYMIIKQNSGAHTNKYVIYGYIINIKSSLFLVTATLGYICKIITTFSIKLYDNLFKS